MSVVGTFVEGGAGRILVVSHEPNTATNRAVLVLPAFAEEMNKSRRLLFETGAALAARGRRVLIPDLHGTGDSEGQFSEARWDVWIEDLAKVVDWSRSRGVDAFDALLVRFGATLLADVVRRADLGLHRIVAWQPVPDGSEILRQLVRMKAMAMRMAGERGASQDALLSALLDGSEPVELGGYLVAPALARRVAEAVFSPGETRVSDGLVLELVGAARQPMEPGSGADAHGWRREQIAAERFWLAVEPQRSPAVVAATVDFLCAERSL